jgi:hypothetical protein
VVALERDSVRWYRRRRVHIALGLLVAVLTAFWAGQRATNGVRANLDSRLRDAGAGTDAALVTLEAEQLSALRAVAFTEGVGHALATKDIPTLNRLVTPIQGNSDVPMLDVVFPKGRVVLAVRAKGAPPPVASRAGMPAIRTAVADAHARRGGRSTLLAIFQSGPTLVTVGPILDGSSVAGAALAMTPLADALGRFSQQVGATLTAYDRNGQPLATTATFEPPDVPENEARALFAGGATVTRYVRAGDRELLGRLVVDHRTVALLGASLDDNSPTTGHAVFLFAAIGLICAMLIVGSFSLRLANRWWT